MSLVDGALVLSPMVDVTDAAFRSIAREWGADVTCSEMVSSAGLVHGNPASWDLVRPWQDESPYGVQIMGGDPDQMGDAARQIVERIHPDFIDINLGCPSPNILRSCAGGFLLRDPPAAGRVMRSVVEAAGDTPVSVKMRLGPSAERHTFLDVGAEAESAGAAWCTLHGRTVEQMYRGEADWNAIGRLVDALSIPVVGNGDLRTPEDVLQMRDATGCAGFFIARAAMNDPTIFRRMRQALDGQEPEAPPALEARLAAFQTYLERCHVMGTPHIADLRRQAIRFVHGVPGAKAARSAVHAAADGDGILAALEAIRSSAG